MATNFLASLAGGYQLGRQVQQDRAMNALSQYLPGIVAGDQAAFQGAAGIEGLPAQTQLSVLERWKSVGQEQQQRALAQTKWAADTAAQGLQVPPEQREAWYQQVKQQGHLQGFDVSRWPAQYNEDFLRSAAVTSAGYLKQMAAMPTVGAPLGGAPAGAGGAAPAGAAPQPGGYYAALSAQESGGDPGARNPASTATGEYQFLDTTWRDLVARRPDLELTPDGRTDPAQSARAIQAFTQENAAALQAAGIAPNDRNLYLAHFLGAQGARSFLQAMQEDSSRPVTEVVPPAVLAANRGVFFRPDGSPKSLAEVYAGQTGRFGDASTAMAGAAPPAMQQASAPGASITAPLGAAPGMLEPGNIDLNNRPRVQNADGSISTIQSMSVNIDGQEVLIPTIAPDGTRMSEDQAVQRYLQTGEHLGKFRTPQEATAYAQQLSTRQGQQYGAGQPGAPAAPTPGQGGQQRPPAVPASVEQAYQQGYGLVQNPPAAVADQLPQGYALFARADANGRPIDGTYIAVPIPGTPAAQPQAPQTTGLPTGYRWEGGQAVPIEGLPPSDGERLARNDAFAQADKLRDEFRQLSAPYREIVTAYNRVQAAARGGTGQDDVALVYGFMKMLDPTSVVREGEYATAENTGGVSEQVMGLYNRLVDGQRLTPDQRSGFVAAAGRQMQVTQQQYDQIRTQYQGMAEAYGLDPARVILETQAPATPSQAGPAGSVPTISTEADYNALPSGAEYIDPEGNRRRKQ